MSSELLHLLLLLTLDSYEVEAIHGHEFRKKKGKNQPYVLLYNVKWKNYPSTDVSSNLSFSALPRNRMRSI